MRRSNRTLAERRAAAQAEAARLAHLEQVEAAKALPELAPLVNASGAGDKRYANLTSYLADSHRQSFTARELKTRLTLCIIEAERELAEAIAAEGDSGSAYYDAKIAEAVELVNSGADPGEVSAFVTEAVQNAPTDSNIGALSARVDTLKSALSEYREAKDVPAKARDAKAHKREADAENAILAILEESEDATLEEMEA